MSQKIEQGQRCTVFIDGAEYKAIVNSLLGIDTNFTVIYSGLASRDYLRVFLTSPIRELIIGREGVAERYYQVYGVGRINPACWVEFLD